MHELEQEKEYLTAENEGLIAQIAETRDDIQHLKEDKAQAVKEKKMLKSGLRRQERK